MNLQTRWVASCQQLGAIVDQTIFIKLIHHYSEPHRHYHTLQHLEECFSYFDLIKEQANTAITIEMALWFHDAIYNVKSNRNEKQSAKWAAQCLKAMQVAPNYIEQITQLILITAHQTQPTTTDEKIIVDVDLAILGASSQRFTEYEQQIRQEYSWVPYFLYKKRRRDILQSFLERPVLYQTPKLFELLEKNARINLQKAIF